MPIVEQSFVDYLKDQAVSPSALKKADICTPAHFLANKEASFKQTDATIVGSLLHCMHLTPELVEKEYVLLTKSNFSVNFDAKEDGYPDLRKKDNTAVINNFRLINPNKSIIIPELTDMANAMSKGINGIPGVHQILDLNDGIVEKSVKLYAEFDDDNRFLQFIDLPEDPQGTNMYLKIKTRPDYYRPKYNYAVDLKTTQAAHPDKFPYEIFDWGYHIQAAWVLDCLTAIYGSPFDTFYFIAVEKKAPYSAIMFECSGSLIENGREDYIERLEWLKQAYDTGYFPGYEMFATPRFTDDGKPVDIAIIEIDLPSSYYYQKNQRKQKQIKNELRNF